MNRLLIAAATLLLAACSQLTPAPDSATRNLAAADAAACPAEDDVALAKALGTERRFVERIKRRLSYSGEQLCTLPKETVAILVSRVQETKHRFDQPDKALEFRAESLKSDDGKIREAGLQEAIAGRELVLANGWPKAKAGGLTPGKPFWTELGPNNNNVGGRTRAILPLSATRLVSGSVSGGLWLSADTGASWTAVNDFMTNIAISCLVPDPADNNIVYVCTGEGFGNFDAVRGNGIYRITGTSGAPDTWVIAQVAGSNPVTQGSQWNFVNRLAIVPNAADPSNTGNRVIVAATNLGIYRSADHGISFTRVFGSNPPGFTGSRVYADLKQHPLNWNQLVAGEGRHSLTTSPGGVTSAYGNGIAYSMDGGASWTALALGTTTPTGAGSPGRVEVTYAAGLGNTWFAFVDRNNGELWRALDVGAGNTWTRIDNTVTSATNAGAAVLSGQGWYNNAVWSSPDGSKVIVGGGGTGIRLSVDFGVNWGTSLGGIHVDHHAIVPGANFASTGTVFFGNDGGIYRAAGLHTVAVNNPAGLFTDINNTRGTVQFYGGAGVAGRITGGTQDNGSWTYNGSTWARTFGSDGGEGAVDPTDSNYVYGSTQNMGLFRSTTGGTANSGAYICNGIADADCAFTNPASRTNFIPPFLLDPNNPNTMLAGGESLWRSTNVKATTPAWASIKGPQLNQINGASTTFINIVAIAPGNSDLVWIGYNDGQVWGTANGTAVAPTWTRVVFTGITNPTRRVMRIVFDQSNSQHVWVTFAGYNAGNVVVTSNGGTNWTDITGNLPAAPVRSLVRHPALATTLYVGTEVGLFASDTGGTTWSTQSEGPGTVSVEELFFTTPATLVASTHGRGMFQATINLAGLPGTLLFSQAAVSGPEGTTVNLQVQRVGGSSGVASVAYNAAGGTATSGTDYAATAGTLNWANGDTSTKTISIPLTADANVEGNETFVVTLSGAVGAALGAPSAATVTIVDPDAFPVGGALPVAWTQPTTLPGTNTPDPTIVKGWVIDNAVSFEGAQSLRADAIGDLQKAVIELRTYTAAGTMSFARRVSSELNFDFLRFYIDGVQQASYSGEVAFSVVSFPVTAGMHTFRWSYQKDDSVASGSDTAWIDALAFPATGLAPAGDQDNDGIPNAIEFNEGRNPTVKDNDVFAAAAPGPRLFAMQQYRDFLGREGDAAGIVFYTNGIVGGTIPRTQVIENFFLSPEFGGVVAPVTRLYFAFFSRIPDYPGLTFQVNAYRTGTPLAVIASNFAASPEFIATYGALNNTQYVTLLYQNVLGRTPVQAEINFYVNLLTGGTSRGQVMLNFSESPEYQALKFNAVYVTNMYVGMLRRAPEQAGFDFWVAYMAGGSSGQALIAGFLNAPEYHNRFLP